MRPLRDIIQQSCAELANAEPVARKTRLAAGDLDHVLRNYFRGRLGCPSRDNDAGYLNSSSALACLKTESYRTQLYQAALLEAVKNCLKRKGSCRVAYIGTGPAATLALRLMTVIPSEGVSITFIEGHKNSYSLVDKFLEDLEFTPFVENVLNVNAMSPEGKAAIGGDFDVVITETMHQALIKEKQAHITLNLGEEILTEGGIWLPESVDVHLESSRRMAIQMPFYSLRSKGIIGHAEAFGFDAEGMRVSGAFDLGKPSLDSSHLSFCTNIQIDDQRRLESGRSVITRPWLVALPQWQSRYARVAYDLGGSKHQHKMFTSTQR